MAAQLWPRRSVQTRREMRRPRTFPREGPDLPHALSLFVLCRLSG